MILAQRFLGWFREASITYDWPSVSLAHHYPNMNFLLHSNDPEVVVGVFLLSMSF